LRPGEVVKGKDRAALRAEAHHLAPAVHVGGQGLTDSVVQTLDDTLRTRELVKVKLGKGTDLRAKEAAGELAERTGSEVIQVIGRTVTLYRENPELER
jgi:RNA-binding protein